MADPGSRKESGTLSNKMSSFICAEMLDIFSLFPKNEGGPVPLGPQGIQGGGVLGGPLNFIKRKKRRAYARKWPAF